jgi:riboflavin synthase
MFSRVDMFKIAKKAIIDSGEKVQIERYTVPGVKDLPVACKRLLEEYGCDLAMALGMPGPEEIDKQCAHEASTGIIQAQLLTNKHIIEVFIHMSEAKDDKDLFEITQNRTHDHALNAIALLKGKDELSRKAGQGIRQGRKNVGGLG